MAIGGLCECTEEIVMTASVSPEVIELKPCPFCGGRAEFVKLDRSFYRFAIQCQKCDAVTGGSVFPNDSFNASVWNKRYS